MNGIGLMLFLYQVDHNNSRHRTADTTVPVSYYGEHSKILVFMYNVRARSAVFWSSAFQDLSFEAMTLSEIGRAHS